jgi:hypothetical protein
VRKNRNGTKVKIPNPELQPTWFYGAILTPASCGHSDDRQHHDQAQNDQDGFDTHRAIVRRGDVPFRRSRRTALTAAREIVRG